MELHLSRPLLSISSLLTTMTALSSLFYWLWMDIELYSRVKSFSYEQMTNPKSDSWDGPFSHLSVKLVFTDPLGHYIYYPTCYWFTDVFNLKEAVPSLPDILSVAHLVVMLISARLIYSEQLNVRRAGVLLFILQTWLDTLDGVVARAQRHTLGQVKLGPSYSHGWFVDIITDLIGGSSLMFAILFHLFRSPPRVETFHVNFLPEYLAKLTALQLSGEKRDERPLLPGDQHGHSGIRVETPSRREIFVRIFLVGIYMIASSNVWDWVITSYAHSLEQRTSDPHLQLLKMDVFHSANFWFILWFWRLLNCYAILHVVMFGIWINRLWDTTTAIVYAGLPAISVLSLATVLHARTVALSLGVAAEATTLAAT